MGEVKGIESDLHGSVPDRNSLALLLIDVINQLNFAGGEDLLNPYRKMSHNLEKLLGRARAAKIPIIYVNDNFGKWRSNLNQHLEACLNEDSITRQSVTKILPSPEDYYILKPKHSAFYASPLDIVLRSLKTKTLILTGLTAESCILFTAADAYVRDYNIILPEDCIASFSRKKKSDSLSLMKESFKARVLKASSLNLRSLSQSLGKKK